MEESDVPPDSVVEPQPFEAGTVLESRYRIDDEVGRGGMGVVYRGTDLTLSRPVAIKALRVSDADGTAMERFMREARSLAKVEHAGLVPVYAVGREDGVYYMVMKFVEGRTLSAELKAQPQLDADRVRRIVIDVCDALDGLHRAGLIHRDIKPGNLMVGPDGRITVMDLGIVKSVDENTQTTSTALGTPKYMPPEMLSDAEIDGRADQYSLAVIAYQALVGEPPFDGPTPMAILYKQAHEAPEPVRKRSPDVPKNLAGAVEKALSKDPAERFEDIRAFAGAVRVDAAVVSSGGVPKWVPIAITVCLLVAGGWWMTRETPRVVVADAGVAAVADATQVADAAVAAKPPDAAVVAKVPDAAVVDAAKAAVKYVTVNITSDPAGAVVYQGRRALGRTPLRLRRPKSGRSLSLTLKRDGYASARLRVSLQKDGSARAKLEPIFELVP